MKRMPKDKREFVGSVSIRVEETRRRLELAPAETYGGPEGLFRVRMGRRWVNADGLCLSRSQGDAGGKAPRPKRGTPEGKPLFFDRARLADLIAAHAFGESVTALPESAPDLPRNSRVTVKFQHRGLPWSEGVFTSSPPWRGFDGRYYVWVMTCAEGFIAVPTDDVIVRRER